VLAVLDGYACGRARQASSTGPRSLGRPMTGSAGGSAWAVEGAWAVLRLPPPAQPRRPCNPSRNRRPRARQARP